MIKIEMGLPPDEAEIFQGINFIARQTDSYSPQESAKSFSELMGLYTTSFHMKSEKN